MTTDDPALPPMPGAAYPDLAGRVAVVTGGSSGIGAETCRRLAVNGVLVAVGGRDGAAIADVVAGIRSAGGTAIGVPGDATDEEATARTLERVEAELGPVDIVAAFAGGSDPSTPVWDLGVDEFRATVEKNLVATFLTLKVFLPGMVARRHGSIVTMASSAARIPDDAAIAYAAAKAGVLALTRHVATEVAPHGVRVNAVAPSTIRLDRLDRLVPAEVQRQMVGRHPLGRLGVPADIAELTLFLASDSSSWLTGLTVDVAGGRVAR